MKLHTDICIQTGKLSFMSQNCAASGRCITIPEGSFEALLQPVNHRQVV